MEPPFFTRAREFRLTSVSHRLPLFLQPVVHNGATVLVGANIARVFLRLASNLILTRILAPDAFGVIGVVTSISYILIMLSDMGFLAYIVRHEREDAKFLSVIWTVRLARSILLTIIMVVGAGVFASAFGKPELRLVIMAAAFTFLFEGLTSISYQVAARHSRVVRLSLIELVEAVSVVVVTVAAALILRNYWAIIIGMFWGGAFRTVASYAFFPQAGLRLAFDREIFAEFWRFARIVIPSSIITIILMQTDKIFMARYFPLEELGVFMLAATIVQTASALIDQYSERILLPLATRAEREGGADGKSVLYASKRRLFLLFAFGLGGVIAGSELIVRILFDDRYLGAAIYVSILSIAPLLKLSTTPSMMFLIAKGYIKSTLYGNIIRLAHLVIGAPLGFHFLGPIGVIAAVATMEAPVVLFNWWKLRSYKALHLGEDAALAGAALMGAALGYLVDFATHALIERGVLPSF